MSRLLLTGAFIAAPFSLMAQSLDSIRIATDLGTMLAAEEFCDLSYRQEAIRGWIDENTDPADMGVSSTLRMMTDGSAFMLGEMSESGKTAHCRSIERTARHLGFIE